jgi:pilus assembly protein Flp/PilA
MVTVLSDSAPAHIVRQLGPFLGPTLDQYQEVTMLGSFFAREDGQGLVEYALILVLIAIVVIGILSLLGGKVSEVFSTINSGLNP